MSPSNELQTAIYDRLRLFPALLALVDGRIYDRAPAAVQLPYVSFGPSDSVADEVDCIDTLTETVQLDVWSDAQDGKRECKEISAAIRAALNRFTPELPNHALISLAVPFMQILDDPDGITTHGVVQVEAMLEEL